MYDEWAPSYDTQSNQLLDIEQPIVREILDGLPVGDALDAACGTGRHAAYLASLGHTVVGVDASPGMLAVAREKIPRATFHEGDLHALPLEDDSVDLVTCAIALVHFEEIDGPFREFARVLRPGGHLVVSDQRGAVGEIKMPFFTDEPDGELGYVPHPRRASDYLAAALPLGFQVRRCEEPCVPSPLLDESGGRSTTASGSPGRIPTSRPTPGRCTPRRSRPRTRPGPASRRRSSGTSSFREAESRWRVQAPSAYAGPLV